MAPDQNSNEEAEERVEHASDIIGGWGPFQRRIFWYCFMVYFVSVFQNRAIIFYAPRIDFWCKQPPGFENATLQTCSSYENPSEKCTEWEYDLSFYHSTMIDHFDLVCDRAWLVSASQSSFQVGYLISAVLVGFISDRFGRLTAMKLCVFLSILAGLGQAFAPGIYLFIAARVIGGFAAYGRYLSSYILLMEFVGPQHRAKVGTAIEFSWAISAMLFPCVYYLIRHFQHMQFISTGYEALAFICLFKMSESPRWLLTNGHYEKARQIIVKAATEKGKLSMDRIESKFLRLKLFLKSEADSMAEKKQTLFDMYKEPILLRNCLLLYTIWFVISFVGYGLSLNIGDLGGNLFVISFVTSAGGLIVQIIMIFIVDRMTRRHLLFAAHILGAVAYLGMASLTNSPPAYMTVFAFFVFSACAVIITVNYIYISELFPTTVRQVAMGSVGLMARFGGICAPFVRELTELTHLSFTLSLLGSLCAFSGGLVYFLPETQGKEMPDTIKQSKKRSQSLTESASA